MRWWKEFRNPALQCERVGHQAAMRSRTGMVTSNDRFVADRVVQEREWCPRCGAALGAWREVSRSGISSWSAPSEVMRQFEKTGEFWYHD